VAAGSTAAFDDLAARAHEQTVHALQLIATILGHDPTPSEERTLSHRERVVLTIACDALGLDDPVL
jgi:hypothetical protein